MYICLWIAIKSQTFCFQFYIRLFGFPGKILTSQQLSWRRQWHVQRSQNINLQSCGTQQRLQHDISQVKTKISLCIHTVWSEPSLGSLCVAKIQSYLYMPYLTLQDKISQNVAHLEANSHKVFQISQKFHILWRNKHKSHFVVFITSFLHLNKCKIGICFLWLSLPGHYRVTDEALLAETTYM